MDVQESIEKIVQLEKDLAEIEVSIEALLEKKREVNAQGRACYKNIYEMLHPKDGIYFAAGEWIVVLNRNYGAAEHGAVTIQPLSKI
jgi:hypothetical protein